jgi:hypothetical protein
VFLVMLVSVQYQVMGGNLYDAFYRVSVCVAAQYSVHGTHTVVCSFNLLSCHTGAGAPGLGKVLEHLSRGHVPTCYTHTAM